VIVRDPKTHEATGALKESRNGLSRSCSEASRSENLALSVRVSNVNEHGLTRVHSAGGDFEYLDLYDELRRDGQQTLRFYIAYFLNHRSSASRHDAIERLAGNSTTSGLTRTL